MSETYSYPVHWQSRVLLPGKEMRDGVISKVHKGGFDVHIDRPVSLGAEIAIEFYVEYRDKPSRIRLKAKVTNCSITSSGDSLLKVSISHISRDVNHTLNNIIQTLGEPF